MSRVGCRPPDYLPCIAPINAATSESARARGGSRYQAASASRESASSTQGAASSRSNPGDVLHFPALNADSYASDQSAHAARFAARRASGERPEWSARELTISSSATSIQRRIAPQLSGFSPTPRIALAITDNAVIAGSALCVLSNLVSRESTHLCTMWVTPSMVRPLLVVRARGGAVTPAPGPLRSLSRVVLHCPPPTSLRDRSPQCRWFLASSIRSTGGPIAGFQRLRPCEPLARMGKGREIRPTDRSRRSEIDTGQGLQRRFDRAHGGGRWNCEFAAAVGSGGRQRAYWRRNTITHASRTEQPKVIIFVEPGM